MTPKFTIQKATKSDSKAIHYVLKTAFHKYKPYYTKEGYKDTILSPKGIAERLEKMTLYVAVLDNEKIVGTIGWANLNLNEAHIRGMAVLPEYQGTGIASALLRKIEKDIKNMRCSYITLDTTKVLKRAQQFYKNNGYIHTGKVSDFFGMPVFQYAKKI